MAATDLALGNSPSSARPERVTPSELVPVSNIIPPGSWFDLNLYEIWTSRELLFFLVWRDMKVRYKQTAIGVAWVVIQPLLTMMVFSFFFGRLAKMPSEGLPYPLFYYCALLPWTYFATALNSATQTIVEHERVITKVYFPRMLLPMSAVISGLVDAGVSFVLLIAMSLYYHITPRATTLLLPLFMLLAIATALGMGLWLSALNALYRDVRHAIPFLIQFWMFLSPVAYPSTLIPAKWRWLYGLNPMAGVVEGFRWALTGHGRAPNSLLLASIVAVIVLLVGGLMYFKSMEGMIADRI
jgi:lipopolysaccharide transport system permease protein